MRDKPSPIFVTRPALPPLSEVVPLLEDIWARGILTNCGPVHERLEAALCTHLGVRELALFNNGTSALMTGLQALDLQGEVVTTPYSFVATANALMWNGLEPVFADIDPDTANIDPARIEAAITSRTSAILAVHCYGIPCDTAAIQAIADRHGLKVIYDAAHAFGVEQDGASVLDAGDMSMLSFHATKVYNTVEGGAVVVSDSALAERVRQLRNFGIESETSIVGPGQNGKLNEIQAAIGLAQLSHIEDHIARRGTIDAIYRERLADFPGIRALPENFSFTPNHAYFPVLVSREHPVGRDRLADTLKASGIFPRKYFYPLISEFGPYRGLGSAAPENLPVARDIASRVLCLPLYPDLDPADAHRIMDLLA